MGDSKKYPDHTTNGFLEFWGSEGKCGVLWTENLKAWEGDTYICTTQGIRRYRGVLDLELSQEILRQDCIPWRSLFYGLNQFTNKAQTVDTSDDCGSRINDKHPLLSRKTIKNMGCRSSSRGLNATRHPFFSQENSLINYFVHSVQNVVFWRTTPFYFSNLMGLGVTADPKGSNQDGTNENTLDHNNIFWGYTHSSQGILIGCVCSSLGQSKINVGCICCTAVRRKL